MRFIFNQMGDEPNGGSLTFQAESPKETLELIKHFRPFDTDTLEGVEAMANALKSEKPYSCVHFNAKHPWFKCCTELGEKWLAPYLKQLEWMTGYEPSADKPLFGGNVSLTAHHPRRLCHTHITDTVDYVDGKLKVIGYDEASIDHARNALHITPEQYARDNFSDYVGEDFGFRRHESEYIQSGNGGYQPNPNYLKRHRSQAGLGSPWFWRELFAWWLRTHSSVKQQEVLLASKALRGDKWDYGEDWEVRESGRDQCSLVSYSLYYLDPNGACEWDGKGRRASVIRWEEFAKLK